MIARDMPEVYAVEEASFPRPWSEEEFLRCLRQRNVIAFVVERGGVVDGYMIYELHKERLHILSLAVHPERRRSGIGSALVTKLAAKLSEHRRTSITLAVGEENTSAMLFFRGQGFQALDVIRDYYPDGAAVWMEYRAVCDVDALIDQLIYGGV
jgi:ribosomal-protein-alanine N-acetyltransferase